MHWAQRTLNCPEEWGKGQGKSSQHEVVPYPEITNQFHFGHRCPSVGRSCQNHFLGTHFEAQFWPNRKECHRYLIIFSWVPRGKWQRAPRVYNLCVKGRMLARRIMGRGLPRVEGPAWAKAWRQSLLCMAGMEREGEPGAWERAAWRDALRPEDGRPGMPRDLGFSS